MLEGQSSQVKSKKRVKCMLCGGGRTLKGGRVHVRLGWVMGSTCLGMGSQVSEVRSSSLVQSIWSSQVESSGLVFLVSTGLKHQTSASTGYSCRCRYRRQVQVHAST